MTLKADEEGTLIHWPSRPDFFDFDSSVADIFDNMAVRSIPMYAEAHRLNAYIAKRWMAKQERRPLDVVDVGASTGGFLEALHKELWVRPDRPINGATLHATDVSSSMLEKIARKMPHVKRYEQDVRTMYSLGILFDVVNVSYVLQFLKPADTVTALREIADCMRRGGLLFFSHKCKIESGWAEVFQDKYIEFRKENGYSQEEIDAKTKALKNSMFPQSDRVIRDVMSTSGFEQVQEVCRWLQFSSMVAIRT